jgi:hypothetical protein
MVAGGVKDGNIGHRLSEDKNESPTKLDLDGSTTLE